MTDTLRTSLASFQQQAATLRETIDAREAPVRAPQRTLEAQRDAVKSDVVELEGRVARLMAEGRWVDESAPALSTLSVAALSGCVGVLMALSTNLWGDDVPRLLMAAAVSTAIGWLSGYVRGR